MHFPRKIASDKVTFVNVSKCYYNLQVKNAFCNFATHLGETISLYHKSKRMKFNSYILKVMLVFAVVAGCTMTAKAQELVERKHGTVLEQLNQSPLYNDSHDEITELLDYASQFKGTRYRSGSSSPKGFDCSGFTSFVFKKFGYNLSRSSSAQVSNGMPIAKENLRPGDLVFFNGRSVGKRVGHVGIVTKVNQTGSFEFIHASYTGVCVSSSEEIYYRRRYVGACRVFTID